MIDIDELEKIAKAATPGPWRSAGDHVFAPEDEYSESGAVICDSNKCVRDLANTDFIASFNPTTALEMIAEIRRLRWSLEEIKKDTDELMPNSGHMYLGTINDCNKLARAALASIDRIEGESK